jgi:hypothetical protein
MKKVNSITLKNYDKPMNNDQIIRWVDLTAEKEEIEKLYKYLRKKIKKLNQKQLFSLHRNGFSGKLSLPREELKVLRNIEQQVGVLPCMEEISFSKGIVVYENHIVELGLCDEKIDFIPSGLNELLYLETIYIDVSRLKVVPEKIGGLRLSPYLSKTTTLRAYWK